MSQLAATIDLLKWLELDAELSTRSATDGVTKGRNQIAWELEQLAQKGSSRS